MNKKITVFTCCIILATFIFIGFIGEIRVSADSEKKTVRVVTQKELNKALKNSKVETIILRTSTYDKITISSKKAKTKNIIIDAPNSYIINKAKFNSIEIINAKKYTENVSGNTITSNTTNFVVAENKKVDKLILSSIGYDYTIRKGASIKQFSININGKTSKFDKNKNAYIISVLHTDWEGFDYLFLDYTIKVDDSGRIKNINYTDGYSYCATDIIHDDNGNVTELYIYDDFYGRDEKYYEYEYDNNYNLIIEYIDTDYSFEEITYEYDSKNKLISKKSENNFRNNIGVFLTSSTYEYDSKDRLVKKVDNSENGNFKTKNETKNTYNKKGYLTKQIVKETGSISSKKVYTYEYDNNGNNISSTIDNYYSNGLNEKFEYKYYYDEYGSMQDGYVKQPGDKVWRNIKKIGG
ncbi:MAG: hypothetical protein IK014_01590 [Lachnospiraceae bacterium]|nr:hypothetical protein [Lachnospiraceae bacterium]